VDKLVETARRTPDTPPDTSRLALGASLETREALPLNEATVRRVFDALHQVLTQGFPAVRTDLLNIGLAAMHKEGFLLEMVRDTVADRGNSYCARPMPWGGSKILELGACRCSRPSPWPGAGAQTLCGRRPGIGAIVRCALLAESGSRTGAGNDLFVLRHDLALHRAAVPVLRRRRLPGHYAIRAFRRSGWWCASAATTLWPRSKAIRGPACRRRSRALALVPLELLARQQGHTPAGMDWRQTSWT